MISFRFHVVSITAVFLAIAIGVVVGTTYVDGAVVDGLRNRIDSVSENLDRRKADNDRLESELDRADGYIDASEEFAVTDRLTDVPVLLLATRGIDEGEVEQAAVLVRRAGATTPGIVWLESPWALASEEDRAVVAEIADADADDAVDDLWRTTWESIASELSTEASSEGVPTTLAQLESVGFLSVDSLDDESSGLADLAGANPRVLVVTGSQAQPDLVPMVPVVVDAVVGAALPTVVADMHVDAPDAPGRGEELVDALTEELRGVMVLVDHADLAEGRVSSVLALDVVADGVIGRHYGYGDGAEGVLPEWTSP